mmetsp:Transcript_10232/g.16666  ORF Transcript_10232/g.16666 Transcript_10232/m.16666 type:complete len:220 (+) Transcript_10232:695-1354(+)
MYPSIRSSTFEASLVPGASVKLWKPNLSAYQLPFHVRLSKVRCRLRRQLHERWKSHVRARYSAAALLRSVGEAPVCAVQLVGPPPESALPFRHCVYEEAQALGRRRLAASLPRHRSREVFASSFRPPLNVFPTPSVLQQQPQHVPLVPKPCSRVLPYLDALEPVTRHGPRAELQFALVTPDLQPSMLLLPLPRSQDSSGVRAMMPRQPGHASWPPAPLS